jgi:3-hydroxyisobutyrate dehydrogenase
MTAIGFIGLGNMGGPMAANLLKAGHAVTGFDISATALEAFVAGGGKRGASFAEAAAGGDIVVTMLPAGPHVRAVYLGEKGVLANARKGSLLIDCSTIDVETARFVAKEAADAGYAMLDAPVSGGVGGATAATLTFMVGGEAPDFARGEPILKTMGKTIVHALAEKLGLDWQRLFDISSKSSGQCWSMTNYCPVPGPVPSSPANRDYKAGFTAEMMLKDLKLAQQAAQAAGAATPMGANAAALFALMVNYGGGAADFSAMFRFVTGRMG